MGFKKNLNMIEQTFCCVLDIELLPEEAFRIAADKSTTLFSASETKASSRAERVSSFKTVDEKCLSKPIISCLRCFFQIVYPKLSYYIILLLGLKSLLGVGEFSSHSLTKYQLTKLHMHWQTKQNNWSVCQNHLSFFMKLIAHLKTLVEAVYCEIVTQGHQWLRMKWHHHI